MTEQSLPEESIFLQALEIEDAAERSAFIDQACGGDAQLRAGVEALLRASAKSGDLLDMPAPPPATVEIPAADDAVGTVIGPYKLLQVIGEGGMGVVYMAEQIEPVRRKVAIKVIKPGMDSRQVIARFEAERQALAVMDHPNIAKVFDASTTAPVPNAEFLMQSDEETAPAGSLHSAFCDLHSAGRPYFVMELVKGVPITEYCDKHHLTLKQRLELFVPVCQAIQHAHQKGIIHRDIKPSNILMALYDGVPVPKVIDFGVAKATGPKLTDKTMFTQYGQLVGTLEYMSPEQAQFNQLDIDTRSDIYSLGVLIYELLTGTTPFDQSRFRTVPFDETLRIIREEEPEKPSTRLSSCDTLPTIAANRGVEPARLKKLVRGDLDWIVMKALEKERNRRYETANGLARDLEHYLRDEPVYACPPSTTYRLRKFVARNRRAIAVAALLVVALLTAVGSVSWAMRNAIARRIEQSAEFNRALEAAAIARDAGDWPKGLAVVDQAERTSFAHVGSADQTRLRTMRNDLEMVAGIENIRLRPPLDQSVGDLYSHMAEADPIYAQAFKEYGIDVSSLDAKSVAHRVRQSAIQQQLVAALDDWYWAKLCTDYRRLVIVAFRADDWPRTESPDAAHLRSIANQADENDLSQRIRNAVGQVERQSLIELATREEVAALRSSSIILLSRGLYRARERERAIQLLHAGHRRSPADFANNVELAYHLQLSGRSNEAVGFIRTAIAFRPRNPALYTSLGELLKNVKQFDEAAEAFRQSIDLAPGNRWSHQSLGWALAECGKNDEAIAAYNEALRLDEIAIRNSAPSVRSEKEKVVRVATLWCRAQCYCSAGQWKDAIADYSQAIELKPNANQSYVERSKCWMQLGEWGKAAQDASQAVQLKPDDCELHFNLAACLVLSGNHEAYRQACSEALNRFAPDKDAYAAYITARACQVGPEGVPLPPKLMSLVEQRMAFRSGSGGWLHARALAHFRAQQFKEAIARLEEAAQRDPAWNDRTCLNELLLALAHLRLGHADQGRQILEKTRQRLAKGEKEKGPSLTFPVHIANWLSCQILLREAEELLKKEPVGSQESAKQETNS